MYALTVFYPSLPLRYRSYAVGRQSSLTYPSLIQIMATPSDSGTPVQSLQPNPTPPALSVPTMSSPAPLLRPALPGQRPRGPPRLGLAIPPSPNVKPLSNPAAAPSRPALPVLHLATPMGSTVAPHEQAPGRPPTQAGYSASGGSESSAAHSRSGSFGPLDGRGSNPTSAGSQFSALSFASQYGIGSTKNQGDPVSAVGSLYSNASEGPGGSSMEREGSLPGLEGFDKLSLERAMAADVEDLDDEGWRIASAEKRIEEIGSLGEGAGGAVTKCKLRGGKTIFALKVLHCTEHPEEVYQVRSN
jgi:mitogen-activated protein kinase kinase